MKLQITMINERVIVCYTEFKTLKESSDFIMDKVVYHATPMVSINPRAISTIEVYEWKSVRSAIAQDSERVLLEANTLEKHFAKGVGLFQIQSTRRKKNDGQRKT